MRFRSRPREIQVATVEQIAEGAEVGVDPRIARGGEQPGHVLGSSGAIPWPFDDFGNWRMGGADDHCRSGADFGHRPGGGGVGIEGEPSPLMYPADRGDDGVVAEPTGLERLPQPGVDLRGSCRTPGRRDVLHLPDRAGCFSNRLVQVSLQVRRNLDVHRRRHVCSTVSTCRRRWRRGRRGRGWRCWRSEPEISPIRRARWRRTRFRSCRGTTKRPAAEPLGGVCA